jgi:hypothetical protein
LRVIHQRIIGNGFWHGENLIFGHLSSPYRFLFCRLNISNHAPVNKARLSLTTVIIFEAGFEVGE